MGDRYRPIGSRSDAVPGLVVTGSWLTVNEQMTGLYARRMAEHGFAALAFDVTGFGRSAGEPREVEDPERKAHACGLMTELLRSAARCHDPDSQ